MEDNYTSLDISNYNPAGGIVIKIDHNGLVPNHPLDVKDVQHVGEFS